MKIFSLFILALCLNFTAMYSQNYYNNNAYGNTNTSNTVTGPNGQKLTFKPIMNPQFGMPSCYFPAPANWEVKQDGIFGPNGLEIKEFQGKSFFAHQRNLTSAQQLIQEDIVPMVRQQGGQITNTYQIPELAQNCKQYLAQLWTFAPVQNRVEVVGLEMKDPKEPNQTGLVLLYFVYGQSQMGNYSYYFMKILGAEDKYFEEAKKLYVFGLLNTRHNPQYLQAYNMQEQQKANASWSAHNTRMRNNQANFDAMNKIHQDTYNDVNRINMETWRNTNDMSDRMQEKTVDGIWEREPVVNPYDNNTYKVDSGYKYYYVNPYGEYIYSNDEFYNPNTDPNRNNVEWRKAPRGNY